MADQGQKYKIIEKLDSGGMAEIYRGEAETIQGFKKQVAIKRVLPHLTKNKRFVAMFLDEARLCLFLDHANIVHVFDIGYSGNTFFIVMEYVDGLNLRALSESLKRQNRRLDIHHALFVMMEVTKGLAYAHEKVDIETGKPLGIVHRDISPPNILLSKTGEVKLVDFGLAKAANQVEHTEPGVVKGKFSYLSPEAARGEDVDPRADVFACGIILFEMLTGKRLFYGETDYQTVELVRKARVPPMVALNPEIPPDLEQLVLGCLALDPDERYQSAYELHDALAHYLFSNGLKVTNRDLSRLVRGCQAERSATQPNASGGGGNVIDKLIQDEVARLAPLQQVPDEDQAGAQPLTPDQLGRSDAVLDPRDFIDTRGWTSELEETEDGGAKMTFHAPSESPELPELGSLEEYLEGSDGPDEEPGSQHARKDSGSGMSTGTLKGLLIVLILLSILGVGAVVAIWKLSSRPTIDPDLVDDIIQPE